MIRVTSIVGFVLMATSVGTAAPAPGEFQGPAPGEFGASQNSTVSEAEMIEQGREYRGQIEAIGLQIQSQIQQAKNDKDVIRLNCLLDKHTQVKVNGSMMDQSLQTLQDMIARRDEGARLHEYMRITIINQKVQVLRTEADACVGAETNYVGPTKIYVEVPPGIHSDVDQPTPAEPPPVVVQRPSPGSPYE